ncbi:GD20879 [Drosophila simulans]|uniref:GD20879 n=1 Tax=Drosophila simulans TaxID=7240 RepID=B4QYM5_DROSI|nr:GD20879 [Drosophila simulans]
MEWDKPPPPPQPPPKPRRTRSRQNVLHYESLPTAPPAMCGRTEENIFQFPAVASRARNLSASPKFERREAKDLPVCELGKHSCSKCQPYRADRGTIEPLKTRLNSAIEAMDELTRTYALLEGFLEHRLATIADNEAGEREAELAAVDDDDVPSTSQSANQHPPTKPPRSNNTDHQFDLEHSLTWLESLMGTEVVPPFKQGKFKRIRERSKSMMEEDINVFMKGDRPSLKLSSSRPYILRRQSTYSDNKAKVSKWTKVKAAFKWERANVPPSGPGAPENHVLMPLNHEVERYLKVPISAAAGSSSADSIISSSSGHIMSDTGGTPGTISSASSMDDLEATTRQNYRRDSSKSDTRCESRDSNYEVELRKSATDERLDNIKSSAPALPTKSSSSKSLRRSKAFSDFEVLPEDHVAEIKATSSRRQKVPPSPLNLNQVNQMYSDLPQLHSPLKSPKDSRMRRVHSPGTSSVPSSPSRQSDFFGEFESEDLSSGDFSEPTTPNCKNFPQNADDEIFQHYQLLVLKLDSEFKGKQLELERSSASNRSVKLGSGAAGGGAGSGKRSSEEHSPTQLLHNELMSTAQLEQNLTPQFKKKLTKWRAKQQNCSAGSITSSEPAASPTAKSQSGDVKPKIDWNLWSMGQVKLEGQGLCALPDQKDLPEKFQKKLEQWNRLKCAPGWGTTSDNDSLKRGSKHSQSTRRGSDDDRWYKHRPHEKEKLSRLKAIVVPDHTKNIEVKTSDGEVMKFEGISRKFTRKLYEWEKARGIGPEASTFALLHPGYCPIDVRRINKECNKVAADHSPTLSRSLSLDSVSPNCNLAQAISQQASSLSLNDVNDLKEVEDTDALTDHEFKKYDEPEAVMVEVEEHIHDTASPLVTAHTLVEQQTPIYKYEEVQCNDYVNSRRVQSFESHTNLAPLLGALKRADELFGQLKNASPDLLEHPSMRDCQAALLSIRSIYPYYSNNLMKAGVLNAISDVQSELGRLTELSQKSPLDEACCQETMQERTLEYLEELQGLYECLQCLKLSIQGGSNRYPRDIVPDINITSEDGQQLDSSSAYATCDNSSRDRLAQEDNSASAASPMEHETETSTTTGTLCRSSLPTVNANPIANNGVTSASASAKKKLLRLRKMGSRQNSKTESDSSDADTHSVLETPRRLRRKNFRLKQRSLDDDFRLSSTTNEHDVATAREDIVYGSLKVKPGELIEQSQCVAPAPVHLVLHDPSISSSASTTPLTSTTPSSTVTPPTKLGAFIPPPLPEHNRTYNTNANVFVKTKRKLFTTIPQPSAAEGLAVIEKELDSPTEEKSENLDKPEKSRCPKPLNLYKSISLDRLTYPPCKEELRKCQSSEHFRRGILFVRPPLASDSIERLSKKHQELSNPPVPPRKAHLYKKNSLHKSHSANASNRIEHKIAKTSSGPSFSRVHPPPPSPVPLTLPNKQDNTLPRIQRKHPNTPTKAKQFEFPPPQILAPERPVTPLSERAIRLQLAKAQFLQSAPVTPRQDPQTPTKATESVVLQKSISAGSMRGGAGGGAAVHEAAQQQHYHDTSTDQESVGHSSAYDSLPRAVSRSAKISSKLGFATLTSKLRRGNKKPKNPPPSPGSALSALCRQTLMADVIAIPQTFGTEKPPPSPTGRNVSKSQSTPQAAGPSTINFEGIPKSLSEQYVRQLKESDV